MKTVVLSQNGFGVPVVESDRGLPVVIAENGFGMPIVMSQNGYGLPVRFVGDGPVVPPDDPDLTVSVSPSPVVSGQPFTLTFNAAPDAVSTSPSVALTGTGTMRTGTAPAAGTMTISAAAAGYDPIVDQAVTIEAARSVIILIAHGQSNEQGNNLNNDQPILSTDQDATGRILRWDASTGAAILDDQPLQGWPSSVQRAPIRTFRTAQRIVADDPKALVIIINTAVGGAKLTGGPVGLNGTYYNAAKTRLNAALEAYPDARVIMSITQGEQDANDNVTGSDYATAFTDMVNGLRAVAPAMRVVIHQMVPERFYGAAADLPYRVVIDREHKRLPMTLANSIFIPASFGMQISGDPSHFTASGHRTAGDRAYEAIAALDYWQTNVPAAPAAPSVVANDTVRLTVPNPIPPGLVLEYRATGNSGAWTEQLAWPEVSAAAGSTFDVVVGGTGNRDVRLRARSFAGTSAASSQISVSAAPTVPAAFAAGDWTLATGNADKQLRLNITALPSNGGSAITALQYQVDDEDDEWADLSGTGTGERVLTLPLSATAYTINVRAVNAVGAGAGSTAKTATSGSADWWHPKAYADVDYENNRARINGTTYASIAAARTAGAIVVNANNVDTIPIAVGASYAAFAKAVSPATAANAYLVAFDDGNDSDPTDQLALISQSIVSSSSRFGAQVLVNGSPTGNLNHTTTTMPLSTAFRAGIRVKASAKLAVFNGANVGTNTGATMPTVNNVSIGNRYDGARAWAGTLNRVLIVNEDLTDAECQAVFA